MLALKANRASMNLCAAVIRRGSNIYATPYAGYSSSFAIIDSWDDCKKKPPTRVSAYLGSRTVVTPFTTMPVRFYADRPSPPSQSSSSTYGLPDKQQMEKYFFKGVALLWDFSVWAYNLITRYFYKYVVQNPTVRIYWKQFVDKVENSRKN